MAAAFGRSMAYVELSSAAYQAELIAEGWPSEAAAAISMLFDLMREFDTAKPADGVEEVLGRPARTFADYLDRVWRTGTAG